MLLPLKQGLKPKMMISRREREYVVMLLPLKQGLKLENLNEKNNELQVVMLLPLKQGLKRVLRVLTIAGYASCYATSIKTRIET